MVYLQKLLDRKIENIKAGVQDVFWEYQGAFTGQVSAGMVKSIGATFAIVGHSERRKYFGENEEIINLKLKAILKNGLQAVLCVGESEEERKRGQTSQVLKKQLQGCLQELHRESWNISALPTNRSGRSGRTKFRLRMKFWKQK